ncbi:hypothetical protein HPAKL86_06390 [Helicobacter pylori Aklavik86]|uniref:Uncharacterized protein n=1 Tax=Helicobacter pylori Aklavik86 TaxID=1055532 RepID=K7Z2K6_HELPX|nr:hypothetical protein HPAKL86_06390 [Helicobacter pylori Aklavik86]
MPLINQVVFKLRVKFVVTKLLICKKCKEIGYKFDARKILVTAILYERGIEMTKLYFNRRLYHAGFVL